MKKLLQDTMKAGNSLSLLKQGIEKNNYSISKDLFRGADISVIPKYHGYTDKKRHWLDDDLRIVTPYAFELSWLIFQIKDVFYDHNLMDAQSKYFVFGNLGAAAINYHTNNGDGDVVNLLSYVIDEAQNIITALLPKGDFAVA